jgi:hypothetical protein
MKILSVSSRRSLRILSAAALCALLALSIFATGAAGKSGECVKGTEAVGCTLPAEATFAKKLRNSAAVTVQVSDKGFSFSTYAAPIKCTKYAPLLGPEQELAIGLSDKRRPKVGKTYTLRKVENRAEVEEGEEPERGLFEATITFRSAKLVVVKVHLLYEVGSEVSCDGGATWILKRQSGARASLARSGGDAIRCQRSRRPSSMIGLSRARPAPTVNRRGLPAQPRSAEPAG